LPIESSITRHKPIGLYNGMSPNQEVRQHPLPSPNGGTTSIADHLHDLSATRTLQVAPATSPVLCPGHPRLVERLIDRGQHPKTRPRQECVSFTLVSKRCHYFGVDRFAED
jgi:hypothetical protein